MMTSQLHFNLIEVHCTRVLMEDQHIRLTFFLCLPNRKEASLGNINNDVIISVAAML